MEAHDINFLTFISGKEQFVIPVYQRFYSWEEKHCQYLYNDIMRAGESENVKSHFIGAITYIQESQYSVSVGIPLLVIDGQQRLTTILLLLMVLRDTLNNNEEIENIFSKDRINNDYLIDTRKQGDKRYKLLLTETDKNSLIDLIDNRKNTDELESVRIKENYEFFKNKINRDNLKTICKGIAKLQVVEISLTRDNDNPQLIFESMNSTGLALTQADLIRNYILMGLDIDIQTRFYEDYWREMENNFGQENYLKYFDLFVRYYLTLKTRNLPNLKKIYEHFKRYHQKENNAEELLKDMKNYARYFCNMFFLKEQDKALKDEFGNLKQLEANVAYPFLLALYSDYKNNILQKDDFKSILQLLSSYIFRRSVCYGTQGLNKVFINFAKDINKDKYLEEINIRFAALENTSKFPNNKDFRKELTTRDLYDNFKKIKYLLEKLENFESKEIVNIDEYTIEHIMPQTQHLNQEWKDDLGEKWEKIQENYKHTLGNLTLTKYNSEYGAKPFKYKRDMEGGFKDSPLRLNSYLKGLEKWDENAIKNRASDLANKALKIWGYPKASIKDIMLYKTRNRNKNKQQSYDIEQIPFLNQGDNKAMFESLRNAILELDSNIIEKPTKLYVAFKYDGKNFVSIGALSNGLKIRISIDKSEIIDPQGICRDIRDVGHNGTGNTEFKLSSNDDDEINYAIELIWQALEKLL